MVSTVNIIRYHKGIYFRIKNGKMKKIALLGATGRTGAEFLEQALEQGYTVRRLVRNPAKLKSAAGAVEVVHGDVLDPAAVEKLIAGTDIVVSLFGHVKGSPRDVQSAGTANIINAMKKQRIQRIISLSGGGLPFEKDEPKFVDKMIRTIMKVVVPHLLNDAIAHAHLLRESGLKWIIVRGPRLTDDPYTGKYRTGWVGINSGTSIGRADLAGFILKQVESEAYNQQMPFVSR